ncbi:MAG TPA: M81 family metallopeptidase [Pirellulales bacterium]|nr:M81 family metallopeptidase [Pirellulales bacterium]
MDKRVLLAGLFHETHTFLEGHTSLDDFQIRRGKEMLAAAGDGSPLAGILEAADGYDWSLTPIADYRATPGPTVADTVWEQFWHDFTAVAEPALARGVDGIMLVLHGGMVTESYLDVEGELVRRIRGLPGAATLPICGVLDLHANFTEQMAIYTNGLIAYRENPHADARRAATDASGLLHRLMQTGERPVTVWNHPPLMWPPTGTGTADNPMATLEAAARNLEVDEPHFLAVNVYAGFSFADTPDTGVSFTAVTLGNPEDAAVQLRHLSRWALDHRQQGIRLEMPLSDALDRLGQHERGPVLLVEPSDNIGAGAPGDGTAVARTLVERRIGPAAVALCDAQSVASLGDVPIGGRIKLDVGGKGHPLCGPPLTLDVQLLSRSNGQFRLEDPQSHLASMSGARFDMGPSAVVQHEGLTILLTSRRTPPFDLGQWRSQGVTPEKMFVIGVKAAVAHRRAYSPIAAASYMVATPGPCASDLRSLPYRHVRRPIFPLDGE